MPRRDEPIREQDISAELSQRFQVKDNTFSRAVKDNPKDRIEVEIGDSKQKDFKPQAKIMRWDNDVNFSLRAEEHPDAVVETEGKLIKYITPEYEVHQYELDPGDIGEDGGLEFEWVLPQKPSTNVLTATIQTKELNFYYQPALTQEEIDQGAERPEKVVGSYAVYHKTKGGMNRAGGMEYKTGKAFHIFRPKVTDADGKETWGELNIDEENGLLTVTVDQDFLNNAVYPVVVDPTFGYTSNGGSYNTIFSSYGDGIIGVLATSPESGTLNSITAWIGEYTTAVDSSVDMKFSLYLKDGGGAGSHTKLQEAEDAEISPTVYTNRTEKTINISYSISATDYVLVIGGDNATVSSGKYIVVGYDSSTGNKYISSGITYPTLPDPWSKASSSGRYSIYATYTAGGGGSSSLSPSISPSPSPSQSPSASFSPSISPSPSPSQSPSASFSPSLSPSFSPSQSPSASFSPSISPSPSPSQSPSASFSPSISPSISPSQSPSASFSPSLSPSFSPSLSPSISPSQSPSASFSPSISPSPSPSQSPSASFSPSLSPSPSPSQSPSASFSPSLSPSPSPSQSPSASFSPSISPSISPSEGSTSPSLSPSISPSQSPSASFSPSISPSPSPSQSPSASFSPSLSPSFSPSLSPSPSPSQSPSASFSPSISPSPSPSQSPSASFSPSLSPSFSPSLSPSFSPSLSPSLSPSISPSQSPSASFSPSISPSQSPSASFSPSLSPSPSPSISPSVSPSPSAEYKANSPLYYKITKDLSIRLKPSRIVTWNEAGKPSGKTGLIGYNTEQDYLEIYDGTTWKTYTHGATKSITVESPSGDEDISIFYTDTQLTVTQMQAVLIGSTPSVTWTIRYATTRNAAGTEIVTSGTTTTSTTSGDSITSLNSATIPAGSYVWLETTAASGTIDQLHISIITG